MAEKLTVLRHTKWSVGKCYRIHDGRNGKSKWSKRLPLPYLPSWASAKRDERWRTGGAGAMEWSCQSGNRPAGWWRKLAIIVYELLRYSGHRKVTGDFYINGWNLSAYKTGLSFLLKKITTLQNRTYVLYFRYAIKYKQVRGRHANIFKFI